MISSREEFESVLVEVVAGCGGPEARTRFKALLHEHPEWIELYFDQMRVHLLAERLLRSVPDAAGVPSRSAHTSRRFPKRWAVAGGIAAAALMAAGTAFLALFRPPLPVAPPPSFRSPVSALHHYGATGLKLPRTLPGTVRLRGGMARVGLPSGVELILAGPLELTLETADGGEARLAAGRLIAWVPPRAKGLILRTAEIEAWDIGTVFAVSADAATGSRVFVFKGSVQVNDPQGCGAGLCEAGEGVLAPPGGAVIKIASDWPEAQRLFRRAAGHAALKTPADALDVAERIGEGWRERYEPEEAWQTRERLAARAARQESVPRPTFSKKAWVRKSAPVWQRTDMQAGVSEKEDGMMKKPAAAALAAAILGAGLSEAVSDPAWVYTTRRENRHWETIFTNSLELAWRWQDGANSAHLNISGMAGTVWETRVTTEVSNLLWQISAPGTQPAEDVYELVLTFLDGNDEVVGAQTSRLAAVSGAWGPTRVDTVPEGDRWSRIRENAVIPYDAGWTAATDGAPTGRLVIARDGLSQTFTLPHPSGHFGWRVKGGEWGYGIFSLTLDFPGTVTNAWDAWLTRVAEGFIMSLR
jgi:hypothetical protein